MKILWVGDATVSSGFARCTHTVCDALYDAGHEVSILGLNYHGDPHPYPYDIYPCFQPLDGGRDGFGLTRLVPMIERVRPDIVVLLNDPWNIPGYMRALRSLPGDVPSPAVVGWLAVDANNIDGSMVNDLDHVVVWTDFARKELINGGYTGYRGSISIVPLGVDHGTFFPRDKAESKPKVFPPQLPDNAFVVGVVGRNQPRKRLDLALKYFSSWIHQYGIEDAYLYLHVGPTGDRGFDIHSLSRYHGLSGKVILATPAVGMGSGNEHLAHLYSAIDVLLSTTQGEGWGLPVLEAMACGTQCIVPKWSGLASWADSAVFVPCTNTAISAPLNSLAYTVGGVPDEEETVKALNKAYVEGYNNDVLATAARYSWDGTGSMFLEILEWLHGQSIREASSG